MKCVGSKKGYENEKQMSNAYLYEKRFIRTMPYLEQCDDNNMPHAHAGLCGDVVLDLAFPLQYFVLT